MKTRSVLAAFAVSVVSLHADDTMIQLSLTPDIALFPRTTTVKGLSLSVWGENQQWGLQLGLVNGSTGNSGGMSWGIVNYDDDYMGIHWGIVNISRQSFIGWQDAYVNLSFGTFKGLETGVVNFSEDFTGLQMGVVNYAERLRGVQLGFVNVAMNNPWFNELPDRLAPVFPFVNWSF